MVVTAIHPGSWQDFMRKPENKQLSIEEATRKYNTAKLLFENQYSTYLQQQRILIAQRNNGGKKALGNVKRLTIVTEHGIELVTEANENLIIE